MPNDNIEVHANCSSCHTRISWTDEVTDETMLVCNNCGREVGTYGDFRERAIEAVRQKALSVIKDAFKRR